MISFNFVPLFHQSSYSQGSNNSSPGSHFLLKAISPPMLPNNVAKCMLNVASTMLFMLCNKHFLNSVFFSDLLVLINIGQSCILVGTELFI